MRSPRRMRVQQSSARRDMAASLVTLPSRTGRCRKSSLSCGEGDEGADQGGAGRRLSWHERKRREGGRREGDGQCCAGCRRAGAAQPNASQEPACPTLPQSPGAPCARRPAPAPACLMRWLLVSRARIRMRCGVRKGKAERGAHFTSAGPCHALALPSRPHLRILDVRPQALARPPRALGRVQAEFGLQADKGVDTQCQQRAAGRGQGGGGGGAGSGWVAGRAERMCHPAWQARPGGELGQARPWRQPGGTRGRRTCLPSTSCTPT